MAGQQGGIPPQYVEASPYGQLVLTPEERRRRRVAPFLLFCCCGLLAAIIVSIALPLSGGGGADDDDDAAPSPPPMTPAPPSPPPPTPEPPIGAPPGACCCEGCSRNVCVNDVDSYSECLDVCEPSPQMATIQSCQAKWTPGRTCEECECSSPFDCCLEDPFAYEGSPYASADETLCDGLGHDYNCDGNEDELPCCYSDKPVPNNFDGRTIYLADMCNVTGQEPLSNETNEVCGACTGQEVVPGWACVEGVSRRKRFTPPCPDACDGPGAVPVTPEDVPETGECGLFVTGCVGEHGGDLEECCLVVGL